MATPAVARPGQSLRNRRDAPRPSLSKRSVTNMDGTTEPSSNKKRKLTEPYIRDSEFILRKHKGKQPSLILHLYPGYFKFEGQDGSFAYDSPMRFILEHVKKQTVPHKMMEELLQSNVTFYDGCLIVEVHNHRASGKDKGRNDSGVDGDTIKFGMHNYNPHVTPSPHVPYPNKAKESLTPVKAESSNGEMAAPERPKEKEKDGPKISTMVLHPTELTRHEELKILANTPASEVRSKKRGSDTGTPSSAQPPTPSVSMPPTPVGQGPRTAGSQKMCLEEGEYYSFQADMLMATTEPLYLNPCDTPQESDAIIDMLQHPNHQDKPPSPKTRKRTTAEVAADDAQAAEIERRMLIMDERLKATGTGGTAGEAQGAANAMPFQRFKTIDMVRQKHEEAERNKKDEEARKALEKKEAEEQHAQQQKMLLAQRQREMMLAGQQGNQQQQQQLLIQQRRAAQAQAQAQQAHAQQQALMNAQNHAHPQQNNMMQTQQQNFQQQNQASMAQTSPVVRQQTPMMNSSPMMPQGGFPMAQTSSQGPGSPPRPTSAMQQPMARHPSQQHRSSQGGTPQVPQGTPSMGQAMPNRNMTQTPRMAPNSPAPGMHQGTPASGPMQTPGIPHQNQLTPHQMQMLEQQGMAQNNRNMMPDQIQNISNMQRQQNMQQQMQRNAMMQAAQNNPQQIAAMQQQRRVMLMQQQQRNQAMMAQQQQQGQMQHAGSPGGMNGPMQTPQMGHGHPQQQQQHQQQQHQGMSAQQQQQRQQQNRAQQQALMQSVQPLVQQYGGLQNIPQQALQNLSQPAQAMVRRQVYAQQQHRQQVMRAQQQQQQQQQQRGGQMTPDQGGGEQVPGGPGNPQYMAQLRHQQQMLGQMQQQQGGQHGGMNNMAGINFQMGQNPGQGGQNFGGGQGGQQGDPLAQQFQAMQRALNNNGQ